MRPAALAAIFLLALGPCVGRPAALGAADVDDAAVPTAPPPRVAGSEADYTLVLAGDEASLSDRLLVHVEGPKGLPLTAFGAEPDRTLFSRLPESGRRGVGSALSEDPLASSTLWLCFRLDNRSRGAALTIVVDGAGFRPLSMVIVDGDGRIQHYGGEALDSMRIESSLADLSAYALSVPPESERTVYLRLPAGSRFGPGVGVWSHGAFMERSEARLALMNGIAGFAAAVCAIYLLLSSRHWPSAYTGLSRRADRALSYAMPILACASVLLGRTGGVTTLASIGGGARYALALALGAAAAATECVLAARRTSASRSDGGLDSRRVAAVMATRAAAALAFASAAAFGPLSVASLALPAWLTLTVSLAAGSRLSSIAGSSRASHVESKRLLARLESETRGGIDFMTATAAALRGPLHGMIGMLEDLDALVQDAPRSARASSDLAFARAEAARLDILVSNILSYSGMGPSRLAAENVDLASVARSAASLLRVSIAGKGVRVAVDAPVVEIRGDIGVSHRLLYTAMSHASRVAGASTVRVTASSDESRVRVLVQDDGAALASPSGAVVDKGAFSQERLELDIDSIVLGRLAGLLGGSYRIERRAGMNVRVFDLPRQAPFGESVTGPRALSEFPSAAEADCDGHGEPARPAGRVLVAGNEPVALLSIKRRLESSGWSVRATVSSADALEMALGKPAPSAQASDGQPYDIVIIDSSMSGMSGFEFCESVRRGKSPEALPIILLLEPGRVDEVERAFRAGANDYIVRPASGIELAARVKTLVDLSSSVRRELRHATRLAEFDKYRTLAMLSAGVAHEINTPNNAVLRTVPMLKEIWNGIEPVVERLSREEDGFSLGGFGYDDLRRDVPDMLNDLYMGAQDIKKIVEGLKDYARSPSESASLAIVDANEAILYAARLLKHTIAVSTDRFSMTLADSLPKVKADRLKLTQVIVNALENALQAISGRSDGVSVSSESVDDPELGRSVAIRIADEGVGMEPEVLASVFSPFFTTKRDRGGSGLGMPVALGLVQDMRGTIDIQSERGAGTTVTIRIPVWQGAEG